MPKGRAYGQAERKGPLRKSGATRTSNAQQDMGRGPVEHPVAGKQLAGNTPKGGRTLRARAYPKAGRGHGKATGRGKVAKGFEPGKTVF
jgi:hypothetical protein